MILKKRAIHVFLPVILWMTGCGGGGQSVDNNMTMEDVCYVNKFPKTFTLDHPIEVETDIIGIQGLFIYDSLLVLSTTDREGLWSFLSLPDLRFRGKFLTIGEGPYEFFQSPWVDKMKFFTEKGTRYAGIYNFFKGELYKMNIDESIQNRELSMYTLNDSLPKSISNFVMIDSVHYFCKEISGTDRQQIRYLSEAGERIIPPHLEKLNRASVSEGEDFNILATITKVNTERNLVVEMAASMNFINLYSLDGVFGKTICIGNKLNNIAKIEAKPRWSRKQIFGNLSLYPQFWGVLYLNVDHLAYQMQTAKSSAIMFFDYEGEPLAELKFNTFVTSFDIDFANGTLYTLNHQTDAFNKYDIRDILKAIAQ
jgi:hypothetical protein